MLAGALAGSAPPAGRYPGPLPNQHRPAARVWPTPQQRSAPLTGFTLGRVVGLVRGPDTDPAAIELVESALRRVGVREIRAAPTDPDTAVTVWLTGGRPMLGRLGVAGATGLPAEGYVLAAGWAGGRGSVVLDGVDPAGLYYAARTLDQLLGAGAGAGQLLGAGAGAGEVPGVSIRDWPASRYRGSIEGFYGEPWSRSERLAHLDYLAAHKMNTYEYAPKDDPYLRDRWRDRYVPEQLAELTEVIGRAVHNHITFTYAISPGLSICYSSPDDVRALLDKFDSVYQVGVRSFAVLFDDIDYRAWHCDSDAATFGPASAGAAGRAQVRLLNEVRRWVAEKGGVAPVQTVPTEFYGVADSPYKRAFREMLDPSVLVMWTGISVVPAAIRPDQAAAARSVYGHPILVWDNFPVNDYAPDRLLLGPYTGRPAGLPGEVVGVLSNPAVQPTASRIALFSLADYGWHDATYDPVAAWSAALAELAGQDSAATMALRLLADLCTYDHTLHPTSGPLLAGAIAGFWTRWRGGDRAGAVAFLRGPVDELAAAPDRIRAGRVDPTFVAEAAPWLDAVALWGRALNALLDALAVQPAPGRTGAVTPVWAARERAEALVAQAAALRVPSVNRAPKLGDGLLDRFVEDAGVELAAGLVRAGHPVAATGSVESYQDNDPDRMIDDDPDSYYSTARAPAAGEFVQVDLGAVRRFGAVAVLQATPASPDDYLRDGILEYSLDGSAWRELATGNGPEVRASAPDGGRARYLRYRARGGNGDNWLAVREFQVQVLDL